MKIVNKVDEPALCGQRQTAGEHRGQCQLIRSFTQTGERIKQNAHHKPHIHDGENHPPEAEIRIGLADIKGVHYAAGTVVHFLGTVKIHDQLGGTDITPVDAQQMHRRRRQAAAIQKRENRRE